jgi:hypothetical protein
MIYRVEYRREGYCLADCLRPDPFWGKRIFSVDTEKLGTEDVAAIAQAARETAPKGYEFHHLETMGGQMVKEGNAKHSRRR